MLFPWKVTFSISLSTMLSIFSIFMYRSQFKISILYESSLTPGLLLRREKAGLFCSRDMNSFIFGGSHLSWSNISEKMGVMRNILLLRQLRLYHLLRAA